MAALGVVEDGTPTKHSVRVEWFRREPGGGTVFVKPAGSDDSARADGRTPYQDADAADAER